MRFKLGDKVSFINDAMNGEVVGIIDANHVEVDCGDGMPLPTHENDLISQFPESDKKKKEISIEQNLIQNEQAYPDGLFILFTLPAKGSIKPFGEWFIWNNSDSDWHLSFSEERDKNTHKGLFSSVMASHSLVRISIDLPNNLNDWPKLILNAFNHSNNDFSPLFITKRSLKFKADFFGKTAKKLPVGGDTGWVYSIPLEKGITPFELSPKPNLTPESQVRRPEDEIDLHIEALTDKFPKMNPSDIFSLQMETFRKNLDAAVVHELNSIIFIHGVGSYVLKDQISKKLKTHSSVKSFGNAPKRTYGNGATEVFLK
ncbi:MAG: hypothetical protein ACI81S_000221 [Sphingobacteriales bacterium]|jgi:hypothetical protein